MSAVLESLTVQEMWRRTKEKLSQAGIPSAERESRELVARSLGFAPEKFAFYMRNSFDLMHESALGRMVDERLSGRPLAYVLREWDFAGLRLNVNENVLIPRPETEELLETVLASLRLKQQNLRICDVGTGSGCLAVALAQAFPKAQVWGVDMSMPALAVARRNAEKNGFMERLTFLPSDLLGTFEGETFHAIVANLPYVTTGEWEGLSHEVKREPRQALDGGSDGLHLIRRLIPQAWRRLESDGGLFLEIGHDQADEVSKLMKEEGFLNVKSKKDFAGVDRFVIGFKA